MIKCKYDIVILGTGIYGLYAAKFLSVYKKKILLIDCDSDIMGRASKINQARIHNGMHYPRGRRTIESILRCRDKFLSDFKYAINSKFIAYYGIAKYNSLTDACTFKKVLDDYEICYDEVSPSLFFYDNMVEALFVGEEYTFSYLKIKEYFKEYIKENNFIDVKLGAKILEAVYDNNYWDIKMEDFWVLTKGIINATYSSINVINELFGQKVYDLKYELCEVVLCKVSKSLEKTGITMMDGDFFSIMPYGFSNYHTLTSVHYTPHYSTSKDILFPCMNADKTCSFEKHLNNCDLCNIRPRTKFQQMSELYTNFIRKKINQCERVNSMFTIKAIVNNIDDTDDRETIINYNKPYYLSVLSGKFTTIYEMDKYLKFFVGSI